jgi:hypothetical protein
MERAKQLCQYYTADNVALACVIRLQSRLGISLSEAFGLAVEPAYGRGAFVAALRLLGIRDIDYFDIDSSDDAHRADFLEINMPRSCLPPHNGSGDILTIGNPPFGKNASLAVAFFNKAASYSRVVAFIVPKTFRKTSIQRRLDRRFFLILDADIPDNAFTLCNEVVTMPCAFQVWIRQTTLIRPISELVRSTDDFYFVDAAACFDIAIRRVGVNAGRIFERGSSSMSATSYMFLKLTGTISRNEMLRRIYSLQLESTPCKANTAGCPSISKAELCELYNTIYHNGE